MKKRAPAKKVPAKKSVKNSAPPIQNGLSEAILGFEPGSIGTQLSQVDTLFQNNRWYMISNMRQVLSEIYVEHGVIQTVIDVPVDDGMRGGVDIKSKQLSAEQVEDLQIWIDRKDILDSVVGRALKWNRLFGGAAVLILTDQDPSLPLNMDLINENSKLDFRAVDMWELYWDKQNTEATNPAVDEPVFEHYNYYGIRLHKSRVIKMKGLEAPSFIRPRLRGWGFSIVELLVRSINQYLKSTDLTFEVLDEFKIDVYKMKNLVQTLMSAEGESMVRRRVQMANQSKNYQSAIVLDGEDDYAQKQLSFTGIAETMKEIRMQIACDLRMPLTKIFGVSASGFNSGEDDIENYNAMVESQVRAKCKYEILKILELVCKKEFGFVPDDLQISFRPLRILSAEQEENVKTQKFNRLLQAQQVGLITVKEFKDGCNSDDLLPVQLDTSIEELQVTVSDESQDEATVPEQEPSGPQAKAKDAKEAKEPKEAKSG